MMDVAVAAGVSQTTVSLVLNNVIGARLSQTTRQHVLDAANRIGYRLVRRGPAPRPATTSGAIGFVVNEMSTDPWCAIALDGAREKAWASGLTLTVAVTRGDAEMEEAVFAQMVSQPLVGLIYGTIHTQRISASAWLYRVPTVLLNCYVADRSLTSIVPAEERGGRTATERLIRSGHTRIGLIQGEALMDASRDRYKGYRRALASAGIAFDPELVRPGNWEPSAGYEQTRALMALREPPTAVFCENDLMALGCLEALHELGKKVPDDVAVVGYDDREIAQFTRPALTTVLLPHFDMGNLAAECIIDRTVRPGGRQPQIKVECPLVERSSVGPASTES